MTTSTTTTTPATTPVTVSGTRFRYTERTIDRSKFVGQLCASLYAPIAAYKAGDTPWAALKAIDFDLRMEGLEIEVLVYSSGNRITTEQVCVSNDPLYRREGEMIRHWLHRVLDRVNGIEVIIPGRLFTADQVIALHNNLRPSRAGTQPDRTRYHIAQLKGEPVPSSPRELILRNERPTVDVGVRSDWGLKSKRPIGSPSRPMPSAPPIDSFVVEGEAEVTYSYPEVAHAEGPNLNADAGSESEVAYEVVEVAQGEPPAPIVTPLSIALEVATIAPDYKALKALYKERFGVSAPNVKEAHLRAIVVARILSGV